MSNYYFISNCINHIILSTLGLQPYQQRVVDLTFFIFVGVGFFGVGVETLALLGIAFTAENVVVFSPVVSIDVMERVGEGVPRSSSSPLVFALKVTQFFVGVARWECRRGVADLTNRVGVPERLLFPFICGVAHLLACGVQYPRMSGTVSEDGPS
eukprot:m.44875 g.44875  ORF g.44875 m.44875 type:complete len:155 (+) comp10639_c0_seq4:156-620(+)